MELIPDKNMGILNSIYYCKQLCFEMWFNVSRGKCDSRSPYGDTALRLRDALFRGDDESFDFEYDEWYEKYVGGMCLL
jgi:hypothetical protein